MKLANVIIAATLTMGSAAQAQDVGSVDIDGDGLISEEELIAAFADDVNTYIFAASDLNEDGVLDEEELLSAQADGLIPTVRM